MKSNIPLILAALWVAGGLACTNVMSPAGEAVSNEGNQLYFTSFESAQDTVGWPKYGEMTFSEDVPPDGGGRSIQISGGCIHPHAELEIEGPPWNSYVRIECWGKNLAIGGGLSLSRTDEPNTGISLAVTDSSWTRYVSADSLFCPAGRKLRIEIGAGGFVASAMLVDLLVVRHAR